MAGEVPGIIMRCRSRCGYYNTVRCIAMWLLVEFGGRMPLNTCGFYLKRKRSVTTHDSHAIDEERSGGIQVIARAASILNALGAHPEGMSLGAIAQAVALPRSTVQRIVAALAEEGMVRSHGNHGFRLGPTLLRLVATVHSDIIAIATPFLQALCNETNETVTLARPSGRQIAIVHMVVANRELRVVPRFGLNLPIYSTSGGRALLALNSDDEVRRLLGGEFEPVTDNTVCDIGSLLAALHDVRQQGVAVEHGETLEGISSMGVAIDTLLGRYSVSLLVPTERLQRQLPALRTAILACRASLMGEIGRLDRR